MECTQSLSVNVESRSPPDMCMQETEIAGCEVIVLGVILPWEPTAIIIYETGTHVLRKESVTGIIQFKNNLIINFNDSDERLFVQAGIPTISIQTFLSICCGYALDLDELNSIFKRVAGIHYSNTFGNRQVDFSTLYFSMHFWRRIEDVVYDGYQMIMKQGLQNCIELEIKVVPVLHRMFNPGYLLDIKRVVMEYKKLRYELCEVKKRINKKDGNLSKLHSLCQKMEDKIRRIPSEVYNLEQEKLVLKCNFRSIGTDTFRITTSHINIQGLPKDIRKCFLPRHGEMLIEYDMVSSQIVILAYLSGEDSIKTAYLKGMDLYLYIVAVLMKKQMSDVTDAERDTFKRIILQILYGAGIGTIQAELKANGIFFSYKKVYELRETFYRSFPSIQKYSEKIMQSDYITLPTGRVWSMKDFVAPYKRLAYIMQTVESAILRETLVLIDREANDIPIWLYLCIHDSVIIETNRSIYAEAKAMVKKCFENAMKYHLHGFQSVNLKEEILYERQHK